MHFFSLLFGMYIKSCTFDVSNIKTMKHQAVKFSIEDITVSGNNVEVPYFINDGELKEAVLSFQTLKEFAISMGMNKWSWDYMQDEAKEESGEIDIDIYMEENINEVVKHYLECKYNPFDAIVSSLSDLIADFNGRKEVA